MAKALSDIRMTVAEFVRWPGDGTDARHELVGGRVVAMAPPSGRHVEIVSNIAQALQARLRRPCRALQGGGVARSSEDDECRIPDRFVTCEPTPDHVFLNPRLVVEVLSPSTEKEDRTAKLDFYRSLPSVQAILLVWQDKRRVQLHTREEPRWPAQDFTGAGAVALADLGIEMALEEIYAGVEFADRTQDANRHRTPSTP
jgi:Uma2 family endonuclease